MRGNPRGQRIDVRVTPEERAAIEARSSSFGLPPSTYMRRAALTCDHEPVRVADAEELRLIRLELKRIGVNLNQAVRYLNAHGYDGPMSSVLASSVSAVSDAATALSALIATNSAEE